MYEAAQNADFGESWIVRTLLTLRGMSVNALTLRNLRYSKFRILGERPASELLIGLDEGSRRSFGFYWTFVHPFSGLIRMEMLKTIKQKAEAI